MKGRLLFIFILACLDSFSQKDSADVVKLGKETTLSEVVIRNKLDVSQFLWRVKEDTSFYKAFRNLRVLQFSSLNDIKMMDKSGKIKASLYSKTRQSRSGGCRTMEVLEEKATGDMYDGEALNYYTAELYAGLFFTKGKVCGETNIVAGIERNVRNKSGIEKHKEQLENAFFQPRQKDTGHSLYRR
jgi:hypothetical protein